MGRAGAPKNRGNQRRSHSNRNSTNNNISNRNRGTAGAAAARGQPPLLGTAAPGCPVLWGSERHPRALPRVPCPSGPAVARSVSLLAAFRGDGSRLQVVSAVTGNLAIVKCHVLFISSLRKEKRENYEPLLAAIQFPQEILAFFEEHATACGEESL